MSKHFSFPSLCNYGTKLFPYAFCPCWWQCALQFLFYLLQNLMLIRAFVGGETSTAIQATETFVYQHITQALMVYQIYGLCFHVF